MLGYCDFSSFLWMFVVHVRAVRAVKILTIFLDDPFKFFESHSSPPFTYIIRTICISVNRFCD